MKTVMFFGTNNDADSAILRRHYFLIDVNLGKCISTNMPADIKEVPDYFLQDTAEDEPESD